MAGTHGLKFGIWRNNLLPASGFQGLEDCRRGKGETDHKAGRSFID